MILNQSFGHELKIAAQTGTFVLSFIQKQPNHIIYASTAGSIDKIFIKLGDPIDETTILASNDNRIQTLELEQAQNEYDWASSSCKNALALGEMLSAQELHVFKEKLAQAKMQLQIKKIEFEKTLIRSKNSGVVLQQWINIGEDFNKNTPLFEIGSNKNNKDQLMIQLDLLESYAKKINVNDTLNVMIQDEQFLQFKAKVLLINVQKAQHFGTHKIILEVPESYPLGAMVKVFLPN